MNASIAIRYEFSGNWAVTSKEAKFFSTEYIPRLVSNRFLKSSAEI